MRSIASLRRRHMLALAAAALLVPGAALAQGAADPAKDSQAVEERPRLDVIFVPTPQPAVDRMLELAGVGPDDFVIDLGSGDGRIAISAGKLGARAMGVDLDPRRIAEAEKNLEASGLRGKVEFRRQNLFETDISKATVITMYLLPGLNLKLRPQLLELAPGTRIVSHDFTMGDWRADVFETIESRDVLFWTIPARVEGTWRVRAGEREFDVALSQEFQEFDGTAHIDNRVVPLRRTFLHADRIEFSVNLSGEMVQFTGRVDGKRMEGEVSGDDRGATSFTAERP